MFPQRIRKVIAVFLLLNFVTSVVAPSLSYALTAGPTAPEATSFEPVDTTDLVDLKTGDFTYNIPLLEVPGPAGSYPLNLSYHAGIQPGQEAGWTGLGFNLNPGTITRLVNGYPDDHNNVTNVDRSFWEGGETVSYTLGVSVGIANVASVSAGLTYAQDTYRGSGIGGYAGLTLGYKFNDNVGIGLNTTAGISPFGDSYSSTGLSVGLSQASQEGMSLSTQLGLTANSSSGINMGAAFGVNAGKGSLLGASLSTDGSSPSVSVGGGVAAVHNSRANNVSIYSEGFNAEFPILPGVNIRLGREYQRYWIDETMGVHTFGSLYFRDIDPNFVSAFDTYDLLDTGLDISEQDNAEKVLGGSFPEVDLYTVTGQGIAGNIRPYHYRQNLFRQDKRDGSGPESKVLTKSYPLSENSDAGAVEFRFINDFSNRFEYDPGDFTIGSGDVKFDFQGNIITGKKGSDGFQNNHLAGSKHIEWYSNQEILRGSSDVNPFGEGFINCVAEGFERKSDLQIGGFSITNSSGVTYHYALPAYSYEEYMKSENSEAKRQKEGLAYNEVKKPERYAYTWFLTGVTGPDFVDRNSNGLADHDDWGYWVSFEYKKWLEDYRWRNPGEGFNRDIDGEFNFFSNGKKEIYYLDKIITQSHIAIFDKSERLDGREVSNPYAGGFKTPDVMTPGRESCFERCQMEYCLDGSCPPEMIIKCIEKCAGLPPDVITDVIRPMLKLDRIKLFDYEGYVSGNTGDEHILRSIDFAYDYLLAPGTPNSATSNENQTEAKLTLTELLFSGKKGISLIPPLTFSYKNAPYKKDYVDVWGFYKNDYDQAFRDRTNDIIGRATTEASAADVDAWSLTCVTTSLGAKVQVTYESDQYVDVALASQQVLRTKEVTDYGPDKLKLTFWEEVDLSQFFSGGPIDVDLVGSFYTLAANEVDCNCLPDLKPDSFESQLFSGRGVVEQVDAKNGFIIVRTSELYNKLKNEAKEFNIIEKPVEKPRCENKFAKCKIIYSGKNAWPDVFAAGVVSKPETSRFGGGVRVKSILLQNFSGNSRMTSYKYENGTTTYEPFEILAPKIVPGFPDAGLKKAKRFYKKALLNKLHKQIGISRQLPGPGVMYQSVEVHETNITPDGKEHALPNYSRYEFESFNSGMVDLLNGSVKRILDMNGSYDGVTFTDTYLKKVVLKDYSSRVGNLKSITLYNSETAEPVSKTVNHYLHDPLDGSFQDNVEKYETSLADKFFNQGVVEQTFSRARIVRFEALEKIPYPGDRSRDPYFTNAQRDLMGVISKLETFPSIQTGQTHINYKSGIESSTENIAFDFYSGEPTEVLSIDSYGNRYLSVNVPAHEKYSAMGLKVYDKRNKNMLSQSTARYSYLVDSENNPTGMLSASVQTWADQHAVLGTSESQTGIWRPHASYQWNGQKALVNGAYPFEDFAEYSYLGDASNADWQKAGELTLYDIYSHALEAKDLNGNFASTRMEPSQEKVIANAGNSRYDEMAFSGAEYYAGNTEKEGGVDRGEGNPSSSHAHTGSHSLLVGFGSTGFNFTLSGNNVDLSKKFRASVWLYAPGNGETQDELNKIQLYYTVDGIEKGHANATLQKNKSKSWYLLNLNVDPSNGGEVYIGVRNNSSRGVYFDDFRVHPQDGSLTSFVYDSFSGELTHILDANNFYTRFEYDAMGRLIRTSKELLNFDFGDGKESFRADAVLKEVRYNYGKNH